MRAPVESSGPSRPPALRVGLSIAVALGLVFVAWQNRWLDPVIQPALGTWFRTSPPTAPTVVFIVMDTVRADRTGLCGHDRPTTPVLERLVAEGASYSCGGVSPAPWTLPSHASFFTGVLPTEHGADFVQESAVKLNGFTPIRPLDGRFPTLAEDFAGRGYQTAAVSGNLVVAASTGLLRGFEHTFFPRGAYYQDDVLIDGLRATLRGLRTDGQPLFLFVNVIDAHQPWSDVPDGLGWVPPREGVHFEFEPEGPWRRYANRRMDPDEEAVFLERMHDVYDYAVYRSDHVVGHVLDELDRYGWLEGPHRVVITSDHGELLGEHDLLEHGTYLYQPVVGVPLVVLDTDGSPALPARVAALETYDLVKDGSLAGRPVEATAQPSHAWASRTTERPGGPIGAASHVGHWVGDTKVVLSDGQAVSYDLAADPDELSPTPVPTPERLGALQQQLIEVAGREGEVSDEMLEMLKSVGYVEP